MNRHGARVVRHENTALIRSKVQHRAVGHSLQPGLDSAQKVEGRFAEANAIDQRLIQIGIRQETDAHGSYSCSFVVVGCHVFRVNETGISRNASNRKCFGKDADRKRKL